MENQRFINKNLLQKHTSKQDFVNKKDEYENIGKTLIEELNQFLLNDDQLDKIKDQQYKFEYDFDYLKNQQFSQNDYKFNSKEFKNFISFHQIKTIPDNYQQKYQSELENVILKKQDFLTVTYLNEIEKAQNYIDEYPFFQFRKKLKLFYANYQFISKKIINNKLFEFFSLLIILINSVQIALQESLYKDLKQYDQTFTIIYFIEMIFKISALGFIFNKNAYLKDPWNVLDFFIVLTGIISEFFQDSNLSALRILRVLRPLRTISKVKSLKLLINTIFQSFSLLKDSLIIMIFYYTIFAISGNQIFSGSFKQNCFNIETGLLVFDNNNENIMCNQDIDCGTNLCGKQNFTPENNLINFDNFLYAFLQVIQAQQKVYQSCTFEGWTQIMTYIQIFNGFYYWIFCFIMVFIGAFVIKNLILAVVAINFLQSSVICQEEEVQHQLSLRTLKQFDIYPKQTLIINEDKNENLFNNIQNYFKNLQDQIKQIEFRRIFEYFQNKEQYLSRNQSIFEQKKTAIENKFAKITKQKFTNYEQIEIENQKKKLKSNQVVAFQKLDLQNDTVANVNQTEEKKIEQQYIKKGTNEIYKNIFTRMKLNDIKELDNNSSNLQSFINLSQSKEELLSFNQNKEQVINQKFNNFFIDCKEKQQNNQNLNDAIQQELEKQNIQQDKYEYIQDEVNIENYQIKDQEELSLNLQENEYKQIQEFQKQKYNLKVDIKYQYQYDLDCQKYVINNKLQKIQEFNELLKENQFKIQQFQYEYISPNQFIDNKIIQNKIQSLYSQQIQNKSNEIYKGIKTINNVKYNNLVIQKQKNQKIKQLKQIYDQDQIKNYLLGIFITLPLILQILKINYGLNQKKKSKKQFLFFFQFRPQLIFKIYKNKSQSNNQYRKRYSQQQNSITLNTIKLL